MRTTSSRVCAALAVALGLAGCGGGSPPAKSPAPATKEQTELAKLMRSHMNKTFSALNVLVFHSEGDIDFAHVAEQALELQSAVERVRALPTPSMVQSKESLQVYLSYNQNLQRDADKFVAAVNAKDRRTMETMIKKISDTCGDCHHFFRIEVKDEATATR